MNAHDGYHPRRDRICWRFAQQPPAPTELTPVPHSKASEPVESAIALRAFGTITRDQTSEHTSIITSPR